MNTYVRLTAVLYKAFRNLNDEVKITIDPRLYTIGIHHDPLTYLLFEFIQMNNYRLGILACDEPFLMDLVYHALN